MISLLYRFGQGAVQGDDAFGLLGTHLLRTQVSIEASFTSGWMHPGGRVAAVMAVEGGGERRRGPIRRLPSPPKRCSGACRRAAQVLAYCGALQMGRAFLSIEFPTILLANAATMLWHPLAPEAADGFCLEGPSGPRCVHGGRE